MHHIYPSIAIVAVAALFGCGNGDKATSRVRDSLMAEGVQYERLQVSSDGDGVPLGVAIYSSNISNVETLSSFPLQSLELVYCTNVVDLAPLRNTPLSRLVLVGAGLTDLSSMAELRVQSLAISHSRISDIAVLSQMPLTELYLDGTMVSDLGPLLGLPLQFLAIRDSPVADLEPIAGLPLRSVFLSADLARNGFAILQSIPSLDSINGEPARAYLARLRSRGTPEL